MCLDNHKYGDELNSRMGNIIQTLTNISYCEENPTPEELQHFHKICKIYRRNNLNNETKSIITEAQNLLQYILEQTSQERNYYLKNCL